MGFLDTLGNTFTDVGSALVDPREYIRRHNEEQDTERENQFIYENLDTINDMTKQMAIASQNGDLEALDHAMNLSGALYRKARDLNIPSPTLKRILDGQETLFQQVLGTQARRQAIDPNDLQGSLGRLAPQAGSVGEAANIIGKGGEFAANQQQLKTSKAKAAREATMAPLEEENLKARTAASRAGATEKNLKTTEFLTTGKWGDRQYRQTEPERILQAVVDTQNARLEKAGKPHMNPQEEKTYKAEYTASVQNTANRQVEQAEQRMEKVDADLNNKIFMATGGSGIFTREDGKPVTLGDISTITKENLESRLAPLAPGDRQQIEPLLRRKLELSGRIQEAKKWINVGPAGGGEEAALPGNEIYNELINKYLQPAR
mgnify:CR=1 FL=1